MPFSNENVSDDDRDELYDFLPTLAEEIERIKERQSYPSNSDAFVYWSIRQISPSLTDVEALSAVAPQGPGDKGVDAAWFDAETADPSLGVRGIFFVAQGKCPDRFEEIETYGPQAAKDLRSALTWLKSSPERTEKSELKAIKRQFQELVVDAGHPCRLAILIAGLAKDSLREQLEDYNTELDESDERVAFELYDLRRLWNLYVTRLEEGDLPIPEEVVFNIPLGNYERPESRGRKALVAELPLSEICNLYGRYGLALFAKNLRVPIVGSRHNRGIEVTLNDNKERQNFWFYNNGLTAVCEDYYVQARPTDPENLTSVTAKKLQIVNGCQTCSTVYKVASDWKIAKRPSEVLSSLTVPLRLIKIPSETGETSRFDHKVARFTNSQTPVTHRDLHANDPEQGRIKVELSRDWGFFFEVKRGEWARRLERDRKFRNQFEPPFVFTNEEAGQAFVSFWQAEPTTAKGGRRQIFSDENRYESIFGFDIPVEAILLPTQIWYVLDEWRKKRGVKFRNTSGRRRFAVTRPEVLKHGDLYALAIVGTSLKKLWGYERPNGLDPRIFRAPCENLKKLIPEYRRPNRGKLQQLAKEFDASFEAALEILFDYSKDVCAKDPDLTVRNLLVRPLTWRDLDKTMGSKIEGVAKTLRHRLQGPP